MHILYVQLQSRDTCILLWNNQQYKTNKHVIWARNPVLDYCFLLSHFDIQWNPSLRPPEKLSKSGLQRRVALGSHSFGNMKGNNSGAEKKKSGPNPNSCPKCYRWVMPWLNPNVAFQRQMVSGISCRNSSLLNSKIGDWSCDMVHYSATNGIRN